MKLSQSQQWVVIFMCTSFSVCACVLIPVKISNVHVQSGGLTALKDEDLQVCFIDHFVRPFIVPREQRRFYTHALVRSVCLFCFPRTLPSLPWPPTFLCTFFIDLLTFWNASNRVTSWRQLSGDVCQWRHCVSDVSVFSVHVAVRNSGGKWRRPQGLQVHGGTAHLRPVPRDQDLLAGQQTALSIWEPRAGTINCLYSRPLWILGRVLLFILL